MKGLTSETRIGWEIRQPTAFTLPKQEDFNRSLVPLEGDLILLDLLVNGVADSFGARLLLLTQRLFLRRFVVLGKGTVYKRVWGGYDGHGRGWWYLGGRKKGTSLAGLSPCL